MKYHSALVPRARADIGHTRIWKVAKRLLQPNRKGQRNLNVKNMVKELHLIAYSLSFDIELPACVCLRKCMISTKKWFKAVNTAG